MPNYKEEQVTILNTKKFMSSTQTNADEFLYNYLQILSFWF
jgi:hypothetical protein